MGSSDTVSQPRLLRLSPQDNIAVATSTMEAGTTVEMDGRAIVLRDRVGVGHKVAIVPIPAGAKVIKFGCPIGSAMSEIAVGQHVHTHNLKSDYIPTFTYDRHFVSERH